MDNRDLTNKYAKSYGKALRVSRILRDKTYADMCNILADSYGITITEATYRKYESGEIQFSHVRLILMLKVLGVSYAEYDGYLK